MSRKLIYLYLLGICIPFALLTASAVQPLQALAAGKTKSTKTYKKTVYTKKSFSSSPKKKVKYSKPTMTSHKIQPPVLTSSQRTVSSLSELAPVALYKADRENVVISGLPSFETEFLSRIAGRTQHGDIAFYTLDPNLQDFAAQLVKQTIAPHVAVAALDPTSGKILALAGKSVSLPRPVFHAGFPAASIFKLLTAAAALEKGSIHPNSRIAFRGSDYTLERWNYLPDPRRDRRSMAVGEALGKSCNPVFGRLAFNYLSPSIYRFYCDAFLFNRSLNSDLSIDPSSALIPADDKYQLSRTAAGFGKVTLSVIHAAAIMSGIAGGGLMPRPFIIDKVVSPAGKGLYTAEPRYLKRMMSEPASRKLLSMMEYTTTIGTSRREFFWKNRPTLPGIAVAAKTGTLRGDNPPGINNWFVAAAPLNRPKLALAVIVVNAGSPSSRASHIGRKMFEAYFRR